MPRLEWQESFSVNHPELDAQHRRWVEIINELQDGIERGGGDGSGAIPLATLEAMMDYARKHFLCEERYMRAVGYPGTIEHIKRHNECYGRIADHLLSARDGGPVPGLVQLLDFLQEWLAEHILNDDRLYCRHAAATAKPG